MHECWWAAFGQLVVKHKFGRIARNGLTCVGKPDWWDVFGILGVVMIRSRKLPQ